MCSLAAASQLELESCCTINDYTTHGALHVMAMHAVHCSAMVICLPRYVACVDRIESDR